MNNEQELVEISKDTDEDFTDLESLLAVNSKSFTPIRKLCCRSRGI